MGIGMLFGRGRLDDPAAGMSLPVPVNPGAVGVQRTDPGFRVESIVVENPSSNWILLTDLNRWIQPRVIGKVIRWPPDGPMVKQISYRVDQVPPGYQVDGSQPAPITLIFQDFGQVETSGTPLTITPLTIQPVVHPFLQTVAAGLEADIFAGVAGQTITVFGYSVDMIEDGSAAGTEMVVIHSTGLITRVLVGGKNHLNHWDQIFQYPLTMPTGAGLRILNQDSIAHTFDGSVMFTQQ